jgi:hypothetical protein
MRWLFSCSQSGNGKDRGNEKETQRWRKNQKETDNDGMIE